MREEISGALKKIKSAKAASMDGIVVEILKNGGISIIDERPASSAIRGTMGFKSC